MCPDITKSLITAKKAYEARRDEIDRKKREEAQREDDEYCRQENEKAKARVDAAINIILNGGKLKNDRVAFYKSPYDSKNSSIINHLAREYGVTIPLKVQGWINKHLRSVTIENGDVTGWVRSKGHPSKTFDTYFNQVIQAVLNRHNSKTKSA